MVVSEEILVSLSGGAPWGFRLQGGAEQQKPLQVAKVRKRSKACRAGLREQDELLSIGDQVCAGFSHAQAMKLIDSENSVLNLRVKRTPPEFLSSCYAGISTSPQSSSGVVSPPVEALNSNSSSFHMPIVLAQGVISPPNSEAYYGETDSDADTHLHTHQRRQRRTPPHARSPTRYHDNEDETSEMSGYESATDAAVTVQERWDTHCLPGVPRRDVIYLPAQTEQNTPHAPTLRSITPAADPTAVDGEGEEDSGFQEVATCNPASCPPLVSPEGAKNAQRLSSSNHLVPIVGPQQTPVNDDLSTSYMEKARKAKLQRGESVVEKQVKEARTKCRSIASLLTDAPNPNSKGVLMFKKRRQRAKKYTLTCFGKAEGEREGETEAETEEEGGSSILSGSEVDEEGFTASFDPTWDSCYFDLLEKKSSACPSATPTKVDIPSYQNPQLPTSVGKGSESSELLNSSPHSSKLDSTIAEHPNNLTLYMSPPALTNVESVAVGQGSVVLSPPSQTPSRHQNGIHFSSNSPPKSNFSPSSSTDLGSNSLCPNVMNRTARPFAYGITPTRASVTSVMFRPPQPKPVPLAMATKPMAAVSMVTISPTQHPPRPDAKRAMSSTSLYIPPRHNATSSFSPSSAPNPPPFQLEKSALSPSAVQSQPPIASLASADYVTPNSAPNLTPNLSSDLTHASTAPFIIQSTPPQSSNLYTSTPIANVSQNAAMDSPSPREERISVPAARTGILQGARRQSNKKPMFSALTSKDVSPNPDLMSMVQNMDDPHVSAPAVGVATNGEAGHESGPEEDWLKLGAEACNFMPTLRKPKPPPVAPKPQTPEVPQLAGKGGQLFARRQSRMDRYVVERFPSAAAAPYSPAQTREPSPTPSLPSMWKYSSNIRAPPPINYNPLLSPSCPLKAQKKPQAEMKSTTAKGKGQKAGIKPVDFMSHQPYQLNSSLFSYCGGAPRDTSNQQNGYVVGPQQTTRVYEVKRFSTPPPMATGPALKVVAPRSATTIGEPLRRSDTSSPCMVSYQNPQSPPAAFPPHWGSSTATSQIPPAPTAPLPKLPTFSSSFVQSPVQIPTVSHNTSSVTPQAGRQFKSVPNLSPLCSYEAARQQPRSSQPLKVPKPRFSTSNLGLQPCVWRPGATTQ